MGSVKDLIVLEHPEKPKSGKGRFVFSNRYSVFDWGEMPNHIEHKGRALCMLGAYFFEKLERMNVKAHYLGVVRNDRASFLQETDKPAHREAGQVHFSALPG